MRSGSRTSLEVLFLYGSQTSNTIVNRAASFRFKHLMLDAWQMKYMTVAMSASRYVKHFALISVRLLFLCICASLFCLCWLICIAFQVVQSRSTHKAKRDDSMPSNQPYSKDINVYTVLWEKDQSIQSCFLAIDMSTLQSSIRDTVIF